jgi:hypothetical protein
MSYRPLGVLCQPNNGKPFQQGTAPITILPANYGSVGYAPTVGSGNCNNGLATISSAYAKQQNPYLASMCGPQK